MPLDLFGIFSVREDQICTVTENAELNNFTALFQLPVAEDPPAETFTTGKAYRYYNLPTSLQGSFGVYLGIVSPVPHPGTDPKTYKVITIGSKVKRFKHQKSRGKYQGEELGDYVVISLGQHAHCPAAGLYCLNEKKIIPDPVPLIDLDPFVDGKVVFSSFSKQELLDAHHILEKALHMEDLLSPVKSISLRQSQENTQKLEKKIKQEERTIQELDEKLKKSNAKLKKKEKELAKLRQEVNDKKRNRSESSSSEERSENTDKTHHKSESKKRKTTESHCFHESHQQTTPPNMTGANTIPMGMMPVNNYGMNPMGGIGMPVAMMPNQNYGMNLPVAMMPNQNYGMNPMAMGGIGVPMAGYYPYHWYGYPSMGGMPPRF